MSDILTKILQTKAQEVEAACQAVSISDLSQSIKTMPACRGFYRAIKTKIAANTPAVIAEIKKASPSKGVICEQFIPPVAARSYEKGGAACLSVLTDEVYFQGHNDFLQQARDAVSLPVLRKDFIIDAWQVYQSRTLGADCILLIVAALADPKLYELTVLAHDLGMDVLVEVHNHDELLRALNTPARLIGINNRNLKTFKTSLQTSVNLAKEVPADRIVISESGIHSSQQVKTLQENNIQAFLVGEAFMRKSDPGAELFRMFMC